MYITNILAFEQAADHTLVTLLLYILPIPSTILGQTQQCPTL